MLDAADILVDWHPIIDRLPLEGDGRARRAKAQEIPRRIEEGVQRIGLASCLSVAARTRDVFPSRMMIERIARDVEADIHRQGHRQIFLRNGDDSAGVAMDDRDRAPPVTLARHPPIAQPIHGGVRAVTERFEPFGGRTTGITGSRYFRANSRSR